MSSKMKPADDPRERFELQTRIGKGAYGYVCKAIDKVDGQSVAIKVINLEDAGDEVDDVHQEIAVMSNMNCPQLTKYFSSYVLGENLWIIMEYLEAGSLLDIIKESGPLLEPHVAYIMRELLSALAYLHSERKIHRDVKAGNVLVAGDGSIKLADFGVTGQLTDSIDKRQTKVGTPFWMAPEVICQSAYDGCADVWSAGITAIELCKGAPPYANRIHPFQAILLIPKNPPPVLDGAYSEEFKDFVSCCLVKDPAKRPSAATLLRHPFITAVKGIPTQWKNFIQATINERQAKAISQSADDSLEQAQVGFETNDWNFTMRTGVSVGESNANSRSHSRSNSRMGSFSLGMDASSSSSTQGGGGALPTTGAAHSRSLSRNNSKSRSASDAAIVVKSKSTMASDVFRTMSSESEGSADDILSDDERLSPAQRVPNGVGFTSPTNSGPEGISFPSTFPSKMRPPIMSLASSSSPLNSPRSAIGAPPRPKSITIQEGKDMHEMARAIAAQEERIANLQVELSALSKENNLLRSLTAPYLSALDLLLQQKNRANKILPNSGEGGALKAAAVGQDTFPVSLSTAIQQAAYSSDEGEEDAAGALVKQAEAVTAQVLSGMNGGLSTAFKGVVAPALTQLHCRVTAHTIHIPDASTNTNNSSGTSSCKEQAVDVLKVLSVGLASLDTFDSSNPIQKFLAAEKGKSTAPAPPSTNTAGIDLTAPTPKATHTSPSTSSTRGNQSRSSTGGAEDRVSAQVPGLGSVDLITLLSAYLEDDLQRTETAL